jgi:hypothetical protein
VRYKRAGHFVRDFDCNVHASSLITLYRNPGLFVQAVVSIAVLAGVCGAAAIDR